MKSFAVLLLIYYILERSDTVKSDNYNIIQNDEIPHPDPNDENHDGMIYVGRTCSKTGRRLLANESYSVQYIFGSSFEYVNKDEDSSSSKKERKLKKFGHVDTHPIDGGVVPQQLVSVEPFWLDAKLVSNEQFAQFVARTGYMTEAERFGWSYVLDSLLQHTSSDHVQSIVLEGIEYRSMQKLEKDPVAEYWTAFQFTSWNSPYGQRTKYKPNHPVVHVSHRDAAEYCKWRNNARLPGEREYEAASRWIPPPVEENQDVIENEVYIPPRYMYSWGNDSSWETAHQYANLWGPGDFPDDNNAIDGYFGTSPVDKYAPNHNGFYDLTGNVWEWMRGGSSTERIVRGASFVDTLDGSINHAATLGARATVHGTTTSSNIGFRCAKSVTKRIEHHWTWHDEETHGPLAPEDEYIDDSEETSDNDDNTRKKKKVQIPNEKIRTEL